MQSSNHIHFVFDIEYRHTHKLKLYINWPVAHDAKQLRNIINSFPPELPYTNETYRGKLSFGNAKNAMAICEACRKQSNQHRLMRGKRERHDVPKDSNTQTQGREPSAYLQHGYHFRNPPLMIVLGGFFSLFISRPPGISSERSLSCHR